MRERFGQRLTGVALALVAEALLVLVVITLVSVGEIKPRRDVNLVSVALSEPEAERREPEVKPKAAQPPLQQSQPTSPQQPRPQPSTPPVEPRLPAIVPLTKNQMQTYDIANLPRTPAAPPNKATFGPAFTPMAGDSRRVGSAPNGQPMYAASWYREPSDDELRGYLSTASPGWALIACRTAPDFRVEDCVALDEYPSGSQMLRAVLAATWQFKVRPPRVGGVSQVGSWVRIRIDYTQRRDQAASSTASRP